MSQLHDFLLATVGKAEDERETTARRTLDRITPLALPTLLVEIAAIGTLVRGGTTSAALRAGYPARSRKALDEADSKLGTLGWTKALGGAWHYEVVRRSHLGAMAYGASRKRGDALFAEAARLDTGDPGVRLTEVVALLGVGGEAAGKRALAILAALPTQGSTPYTQLVAAQTVALTKLLRDGHFEDAYARSLTIF